MNTTTTTTYYLLLIITTTTTSTATTTTTTTTTYYLLLTTYYLLPTTYYYYYYYYFQLDAVRAGSALSGRLPQCALTLVYYYYYYYCYCYCYDLLLLLLLLLLLAFISKLFLLAVLNIRCDIDTIHIVVGSISKSVQRVLMMVNRLARQAEARVEAKPPLISSLGPGA